MESHNTNKHRIQIDYPLIYRNVCWIPREREHCHVANTSGSKTTRGWIKRMGFLLIREQEESNLVPGYIYDLENFHKTLARYTLLSRNVKTITFLLP